jgi:acetolactate synthase-1/2/3 large subunit
MMKKRKPQTSDVATVAPRIRGERVVKKEGLPGAFARILADPKEPYLLDVIVEREESVFPMIPAGGSYRDIIMNAEEMFRIRLT